MTGESVPSAEIRTAVIHKNCIWGRKLGNSILNTAPLRVSGDRILLYTSDNAILQCRPCNGFGEPLTKGTETCSVSALCNEHGITQGMYYQWRDQLLSDGAKLFERGGIDHVRERLEHNTNSKSIIDHPIKKREAPNDVWSV